MFCRCTAVKNVCCGVQIVTQLQAALTVCSEPAVDSLGAIVATMLQHVRTAAAAASAKSDRLISYFEQRVVPKLQQNFEVGQQ